MNKWKKCLNCGKTVIAEYARHEYKGKVHRVWCNDKCKKTWEDKDTQVGSW